MLTRRTFLGVTAAALGASLLSVAQEQTVIPENLDHLILGCRDLDDGIAYLEKISGYRAAIGGSHPGRGTRNALLNLGNHSYLEILAPDPQQPELLWHKEIASLAEPRLIGWAVRNNDLAQFGALLRQRGLPCVGPAAGSRNRPDGQTYRWQTLVLSDDLSGNLPFFIEWAVDSAHPSADAPGGLLLQSFTPSGPLPAVPPPAENMKLQFLPEKKSHLQARFAGKSGVFEFSTPEVPSETWVAKEPAAT